MEEYIMILTAGAVVFLAGIMLLSVKPEYMSRTTAGCCITVTICGLLLYGYGYIAIGERPLVAVLRSVFSVCRLFLGEYEFGELEAVALYRHSAMKVLIWIIHLMAFYTTASVAISVFGKEMLKKARVRLGRTREVSILYGIREDTVELGKNLESDKHTAVVYVDPDPDASASFLITSAEQLLRSDDAAAEATPAFLRSIGALRRNRKVTLYALSKNAAQNLQYAKKLLTGLEQKNVDPVNTRLVILSGENQQISTLQSTPESYGYGFVTDFRENSLSARLLIRCCTPWDQLSFDEQGRATEDFRALIVGFGRVGQEVLKQLLMNSQFAGSTFHAAVFDPDCDGITGFFSRQHRSIPENYDITFHPHGGRSAELCDHLSRYVHEIKYVVICTGSRERDEELAEDLCQIINQLGGHAPVIRCDHREICVRTTEAAEPVHTGVYSSDVLHTHEIDKMAMLVNQYYQGSASQGALEDWKRCDYFSRMSCRAFADAIGACLRAAGTTPEQLLRDGWQLTDTQLENLSITEHLRWCAFHFCMGFSSMTEAEYLDRERQYLEQAKTGTPTIRVAKNMAGKTHACLVSWEDLVPLSRHESQITGKAVDYQLADTQNIRIIPQLLRIREDDAGL